MARQLAVGLLLLEGALVFVSGIDILRLSHARPARRSG